MQEEESLDFTKFSNIFHINVPAFPTFYYTEFHQKETFTKPINISINSPLKNFQFNFIEGRIDFQ